MGRRVLLEADGLRLGEDLEGTDEEGAVGGGGCGARRRVSAGEVTGDGEEGPEAAHAGAAGEERRVRLGDWAERGERVELEAWKRE